MTLTPLLDAADDLAYQNEKARGTAPQYLQDSIGRMLVAVDNLDGYRIVSEAELAAAIADHGDICSRMAIPECAPAIFAALSGAAQEQGEAG